MSPNLERVSAAVSLKSGRLVAGGLAEIHVHSYEALMAGVSLPRSSEGHHLCHTDAPR